MSAASRDAVRRALQANDAATLQKYGRFLGPIGNQALRWAPPFERSLLESRLNTAMSPWSAPRYCE